MSRPLLIILILTVLILLAAIKVIWTYRKGKAKLKDISRPILKPEGLVTEAVLSEAEPEEEVQGSEKETPEPKKKPKEDDEEDGTILAEG